MFFLNAVGTFDPRRNGKTGFSKKRAPLPMVRKIHHINQNKKKKIYKTTRGTKKWANLSGL